jgi:hypothetical protein
MKRILIYAKNKCHRSHGTEVYLTPRGRMLCSVTYQQLEFDTFPSSTLQNYRLGLRVLNSYIHLYIKDTQIEFANKYTPKFVDVALALKGSVK